MIMNDFKLYACACLCFHMGPTWANERNPQRGRLNELGDQSPATGCCHEGGGEQRGAIMIWGM